MANRYWVGGTGVWDASNTTPWSLTSNGAGGQSVPSTADIALFDSISNANTITLAYSPTIQNLRMDTFRGTFNANNQTITLTTSGNSLTTNSSMTLLGNPSINVATGSGTSALGLSNFTFNNINFFPDMNGNRNLNGTGFTVNSLTRTQSTSSATLTIGSGTINNWKINGPGTIQGGNITVTNPTKLLDGLRFNDISMNTNPVTFYAGKNSNFQSDAIKGVALSDGVFNYTTPKQKILVLESGTSWVVPNDFTAVNTIHLFGGGGGGGFNPFNGFGTGGGGGGYTQVSNLNLTPGTTITYSIGLGGAANTNGGNTSFSTYTANGGSSGLAVPSNTAAAGGAGGIGLTYNGGSGGSVTASPSVGGTGGGGAGGPYGNGTSGATRTSSGTGQGGGSNGGGTSATGIYGGVSLWPKAVSGFSLYGSGGLGGNAGGNPSFFVGSGGDGSNGVDVNSVAGGGGGGGSADSDGADLYGTISGNGGLYGGGGAGSTNTVPAGLGANGAVIIVYNTSPSPLKHRLDNTGTLKTITQFDETPIGTGSMYFSGSGSYLATSNNSNLAFGTNDFTIEYWIYPTNIQPVVAAHLSSGTGTATSTWQIGIQSTTGCLSFVYNVSTSINGTTVLQTNRWYHVAITRQSGLIRLFLNGIEESSVTATNNYSENFVRIGTSRGVTSNYFSGGHLSNIRMINGTALYTANFAPKTIPVTNIANTSLLFSTYTYNVFAEYSNNQIGIINVGVSSNTLSPFTKTQKITADNIVGQIDEVTNKTKTVFITNTGYSTFTIPADFKQLVSVEGIGAGGGTDGGTASGGNGGGAYSSSTTVTGLVAGATVYTYVGAGTFTNGEDTWFNLAANSQPTLATEGLLAKGGSSATSTTGASGGQAASGVGTIRFSGGNGRTGGFFSGGWGTSVFTSGGGGAAGPSGVGGNAGIISVTQPEGSGGGGGAGPKGFTPTYSFDSLNGESGYWSAFYIVGGNGGVGGSGGRGGASAQYVGYTLPGSNATAGGGGGGAGGMTTSGATNAASGSIWTQTSNNQKAGPGGGGGGVDGSSSYVDGGLPGNYGGAAGQSYNGANIAGAQGIIVFTYIANSNSIFSMSNTGVIFSNKDNGVFDEYTGIE